MTQPEDQLNLHAARLYLSRLLPDLGPLTRQEVQSLTLKAGLWTLHRQTQPAEPNLSDHLQAHARLLRGQGSEFDRLEAQHLRQGHRLPLPLPFVAEPQVEPAHATADDDRIQKMRHQAQRLGVPWFSRQELTQAKVQVSYRVTRSFELALEDAWTARAPRGASRNALHVSLTLAYLCLPEFQQRVRQVQDVRYARMPSPVLPVDARKVAELLARCQIPARGAPTLRDELVQLSYRTTLMANKALRRTLPAQERTLAYLHIDLLALYLTAPDVGAFIDRVIEDRGQE